MRKIALFNEGTYPYSGGGVSTWCEKLINNLSDHQFHLYAVTAQPQRSPIYELPPNAKSLTQIPLWGVEHPAEWNRKEDFLGMVAERKRTTAAAIGSDFAPALRDFLEGFDEDASLASAAEGLARMVSFLRRFDYELTMKSQAVWEEVLRSLHGEWASSSLRGVPVTVNDAIVCSRWLFAFFMPLVVRVGDVDLLHATASAFSALAGLAVKLEKGTPFILTEHGVYFRERYITASHSRMPQLQRAFLVRLSGLVSRLCYRYADRVVAVCAFNQRWEEALGVPKDRLQVIHNGVDVDLFVPSEKPAKFRDRPTVVAAVRVFPLKDIETMVRGADLVRRAIPNVLFMVFGSLDADVEYTSRVRALIAKLGLGKSFQLMGSHPRPSEIYNQGDITALTSISEAFPYTVLESMSCARPVVATDVGGVAEVVADLGRLVAPQDPKAFASACVELLTNDELRLTLGRRAREQIVAHYRDQVIYESYVDIYGQLT